MSLRESLDRILNAGSKWEILGEVLQASRDHGPAGLERLLAAAVERSYELGLMDGGCGF